jgi:flagellar basal body P-ring formation protein FlgA
MMKTLLALAFSAALCGWALADAGLVTTRTIYPGQEVLPEALRRVEMRAGLSGRDMARNTNEVAGMIASRTILPGRAITLSMLRKPYLIEAGKPVRVQYAHAGLTISIAAVPLGSGGAGDMIQLRNPGSGKSISGRVLADGTVMVGP